MYQCENDQFEKQKIFIKKVLKCSEKSKYYKEIYEKNNIDVASIDTYQDFCRIPILTKAELNDNKYHMITDEVRRINKDMYLSFGDDFKRKKDYLSENNFYLKITSGSTGIPVEIFKSKYDLQREYLGFNYFRKKTSGIFPSGKYIWIWPANKYIRQYFYDNPEMKVYRDNDYGYKYMMEEYSDQSFKELSEFIVSEDIQWITAPPSMLYYYSQYISNNHLPVKFGYIECHSEKLYQYQAELIYKTFGTTPVSVYSSNEVQFMGISCQCGNIHVIPQNSFIELLAGPSGTARVVATSLACLDLPIIRYDLGDVGDFVDARKCKCGIESPIIQLKEYRANDFLITKNGKKYEPFILTDLMLLIRARFSLKIDEYIIYQKSYDEIYFCFNNDALFFVKNQYAVYDFIEAYLLDITGFVFTIKFCAIDCIREKVGVSKFKYFVAGDF